MKYLGRSSLTTFPLVGPLQRIGLKSHIRPSGVQVKEPLITSPDEKVTLRGQL